jgi:5-methylcytosine-specific restriction endonuclease McrA
MTSTGLAPSCLRCRHRHLPALRCWLGRYVAETLGRVLARYGDTCCHCGRPGSRSVEHVIPRSVGGTDDLDNLRPAHLVCNVKRGTRPMAGYGIRTITETRSNRW